MSKIEWTDATWNPVVGCTKVSAGCDNCYAERMAGRLAAMEYSRICNTTGLPIPVAGESGGRYNLVVGTDNKWNGKVVCDESALEIPLHRRKPRMIFVCSMSDLFHKSVPFEFIKKVRQVAIDCPQHTLQFLTKRPEIALEFTQWLAGHDDISIAEWPRNCWLGVTAENQEQADKRIPILLQIPAAVRFVSIEPMLGAVDLEYIKDYTKPNKFTKYERIYSLSGERSCLGHKMTEEKIDQVIVGGESGPGARPMPPDCARGVRDQCVAAGVPFFFKQWGEWLPGPQARHITDEQLSKHKCQQLKSRVPGGEHIVYTFKVGKKKAGRLLDGKEWSQYPK